MDGIQQYLSDITIITYLIVLAAGVTTSFTPCVYPLIPILVGVIGASKESSKWRNFILSFVYVLGMAITFSTLGMIAAITGKLFGSIQTSSLAHLIIGNILILFGLVLLNVITIPTYLLNKMGAGKIAKSSSVFSVLFMGIASGFVAAPCTAAVLGALLTFVATTQNVIVGFSLLFTFAIGLGTILIIVGTFTGILKALPKSEKLMHVMEKGLAFFMILLGEYFIFKAGFLSF
ncbi:MAG: sulfite exporter TauE/SafE family protein [Candidatus Aureabacteria bacterium]|nr:sulfite exporter TauE/SafE family protein [Candidatus Auribacterota bacterium]